MARAHDRWTVLPHGPLEKLTGNLWRVEGSLPDMPLKRVLTIARMNDGRLLIHNAIALEEAAMAEIERWGTPAFLIVPNGWHRLDARVFKDRYPDLVVLCPRGAARKVARVVAVDGSYNDFEGDEAVTLSHLVGVKESEGVLEVHSDDGVSLVFNDVIFNLPHMPGLFGLVYRLLGSTGGPKVTRIGRLLMIKDRRAFVDHLLWLSQTPDLRRVIVSHGAMESADPAGMLRAAAATVKVRR
jgi:hypothetical protein